MLTLTQAAVEKVKALMQKQDRQGAALRIFVQGGGCAGFRYGMAFDDVTEETDVVLDFSGLKVLVDELSSPYLEGAQVDYQEGLDGAGFAITNPNVESSCGCGNSFKKKGEEGAARAPQGHGGCCG